MQSNLVDGAAFEESFERMLERESDLADAPDDEATEISARELTEPPPASNFREDRSPSNGSSMAFLLEVGEKRALFLGDAHPSTIAAPLRQPIETPVDLAVLKASHHGSKKNTSPDFCSTFRTAHALISTDGSKHGHPDIETLLWLVSTQPGDGNRRCWQRICLFQRNRCRSGWRQRHGLLGCKRQRWSWRRCDLWITAIPVRCSSSAVLRRAAALAVWSAARFIVTKR